MKMNFIFNYTQISTQQSALSPCASFFDVGEDYFHALTNTPFGYPTSDAARRTGNHPEFAFKLFHCLFSWILSHRRL
jgi:hypothetical protein